VRPIVHHYTAVSRDLASWLVGTIGIPANRVTQIYNGVDTELFHPACARERRRLPDGFAPEGAFVVGTVGRMHTVKDQLNLVRAFLRLLQTFPEARARVRLMLVGDGPLRGECRSLLASANAGDLAWLPGECSDIPELMRSMDLFVLPSLGEGISNTILEAMASGLPVVATRVGGNPELVLEDRTGTLVPAADPEALMHAMHRYLCDPDLAPDHGSTARAHVEANFSWNSMVSGYMGVYDKLLRERLGPPFGHHQP
jgi:sugar transferase (PEP-CTERM/EpsH1 system associated)